MGILELLFIAVGLSMDALAVGITFSFFPELHILPSSALIGLTSFSLSLIGTAAGYRFGRFFESGAQILGGLILLFIGLKILLEHMGVLEAYVL